MELTHTGQEQEEDKKSAGQRTQEFLSGLGITIGGMGLNYKKQNVFNVYKNRAYPGYNNPRREAEALRNQPGAQLRGTYFGPHGEFSRISSPEINKQLYAVSNLYPYVDVSKVRVNQGEQPGSSVYSSAAEPGAAVFLGQKAGPFSLAHELGHVASIQKPGKSLSGSLHKIRRKIRKDKDLTGQVRDLGVGGAALVGATSESLLGAMAKGALVGVTANAPLIGSEIAATHKGLKIMKESGSRVPYGTGLSQIGGYITSSILTPTAVSATAYGVKKVANALMQKAKNKKQNKEKQP